MSTNFLQPTKTHQKPLYIIIDERTPGEHAWTVINTLETLLKRFGREAGVSIERGYYYKLWCKDLYNPHCHPLSHIENCRGSDGKVNAICILKLSKNERWQQTKPHYDIHIVDNDIIYDGNPSTNLLFEYTIPAISSNGQIYPGFAGSVISIGALKTFYRHNWETTFQIIAAQALGYLFGLPNPDSPYYIGYSHPLARENIRYFNHCSYEYCAMRQVNAVGSLYIDVLDLAKNILKHNPYYLYCEYDWGLLMRNLRRLFG
jgi:hypothetical protein